MALKYFFLVTAVICSSFAASDPRIVITNTTLIDGLNPDRDNMTIILDGDKIASISDTTNSSSNLPDDVIINGTGKFVIPGLWDAHVHLTFIPEIDHKTYYDLFLDNGITSIRDTGATMEKLRPALEYARLNPDKAPRLFFSGPLIDGIDRVYKGMEAGFPELSIGIDENSDIEGIVDDLVAEGATFLKSYEMLTRTTYLKLLEIANRKGLRVTGHIPLSIDLLEAIDAGLGGMQHIRNLDLACAMDAAVIRNERNKLLVNKDKKAGSALRSEIHSKQRYKAIDNYDEGQCAAIIQALARKNVFQTPTLTINTYGSKRFFADPAWQDTYKYLPDAVQRAWYAESIELSGESTDPEAIIFDDWSMRIVGLLNQNNVKILAGTDTPIGYLTPGFSLHKELELLVEAGLSPREAIKAATFSPAEFFNLENEMGTLSEGKIADILILNSNPLADITHTQDIHLVVAKGAIHQSQR